MSVARQQREPRRARLRERLDVLYRHYTRASFVGLDPVRYPRRCATLEDREVAALLAAALAYGRVAQIARNLDDLFVRLGPSPSSCVMESTPKELRRRLTGFRHRWTTGEEIADLLAGLRGLRERYGSLEASFAAHATSGDETILPALSGWVRELCRDPRANSLVSDPAHGSACKRMHLFLRWMVRSDAVDPGGWTQVSPGSLRVPVDVHMHRVGRALGFTKRKAADLRTAGEITAGFRALCPEDPVKYDFALTRPGILGGGDLGSWLRSGAPPSALLDAPPGKS